MHKNYTIGFRNYNRNWSVFSLYMNYLDQLHAFEQYHMDKTLKYISSGSVIGYKTLECFKPLG